MTELPGECHPGSAVDRLGCLGYPKGPKDPGLGLG